MLKKIYQELLTIRKELQTIRNGMKPKSEKEFKNYINRLLAEDCFQKKARDSGSRSADKRGIGRKKELIMADKYEIRKSSKIEPNVFSTVARSDTWEWAKKIADVLNICVDSKFSVFLGEKEILSLEDAMRSK